MIKVGILTASDSGSRGEREDASGPAIKQLIESIGAEVVCYVIVADDAEVIARELMDMADHQRLDVVFTTGGTGLGPNDKTPEATYSVIHKEVPGIPEAIRMESLKKTPHAMLSRATAGIRGSTLIVNLPGSPRAVKESMSVVLPAITHAVEVIKGHSKECARLRTDN
jgi:molybdopterin adenylyltransferase